MVYSFGEGSIIAIKDKIKKRRAELNMTLEDVAKVVGVARQTIQKYENGVVSNIPSDKIEALAKALRTTPAFLMGWEESTGDIDEETAQLAQEIRERQELRTLFDTTRRMTPETLRVMQAISRGLENENKEER